MNQKYTTFDYLQEKAKNNLQNCYSLVYSSLVKTDPVINCVQETDREEIHQNQKENFLRKLQVFSNCITLS